jgi:hypothetical protein
MNTDFAPYTMLTVVAERGQRQLFRWHGRDETAPISFQHSLDAWVESFHTRNGFSRDRLDAGAASACDAALRATIRPYCPEGIVEQSIIARILWGVPQSGVPS